MIDSIGVGFKTSFCLQIKTLLFASKTDNTQQKAPGYAKRQQIQVSGETDDMSQTEKEILKYILIAWFWIKFSQQSIERQQWKQKQECLFVCFSKKWLTNFRCHLIFSHPSLTKPANQPNSFMSPCCIPRSPKLCLFTRHKLQVGLIFYFIFFLFSFHIQERHMTSQDCQFNDSISLSPVQAENNTGIC